MRMRHNAQRQHIIHSLDTLLYQLHTVSFLCSPAAWTYICRCVTQFNFSRPREVDAKRTLRFWYSLVLLVNIGAVSHATAGASEGGALLDFVGMGHKPHKMQLLFLDLLIIFLEIVLVTIAYETSIATNAPNTPDLLLPAPTPTSTPPNPPNALRDSSSSQPESESLLPHTTDAAESLSLEDDNAKPTLTSGSAISPYVLDLRLRAIVERMRNPPAAPGENDGGLPIPNTAARAAGMDVPRGIEWLLNGRRLRPTQDRERERRREARRARRGEGGDGDAPEGQTQGQQLTVPGGMDG